MAPEPSSPIYAQLTVAPNGNAILDAGCSGGYHTVVALPSHLAQLLKFLFQRHLEGTTAAIRAVNTISAKDLAYELKTTEDAVRVYVYRLRNLIAATAAESSFANFLAGFIAARAGWGYRLHEDAVVSLQVLGGSK